MTRRRRFPLILAALLGWIGFALADDTQYRPALSLGVLHTPRFDARLYGELRLSDSVVFPAGYLVSPKFQVHPWPFLSFGLNYTFFEQQVSVTGTDDFQMQWTHRLEFEADPHWTFTNGVKLISRNRLEYRWIEDQGSHNTRSRHLAEIDVPLHWFKPLRGVFTSYEFFWDWEKNRNSENRVAPLGIDFRLAQGVSLRACYLLQSRRLDGGWDDTHALYSVVSVTLR